MIQSNHNDDITILHNGWEHRKHVMGWTCCTDEVCLCGAKILDCSCGLHIKTSGGIVVG